MKLLLFPLRLCVGWGLSPRLLSLIGATMLVLLRISIGFHFYTEGLDKYQSGNWDAAPFFANARGPFAEHYRKLVWDADGSVRRDLPLENDSVSLKWLAGFRDRVARHYGFDENQVKQAQVNYAATVERLNQVLASNEGDLSEFDQGIARMDKLMSDPARSGVDSLKGQRETIRKEMLDQVKPVFEEIDAVWGNYEVAQNMVATKEQRDSEGYCRMGKPPVGAMDTNRMNQIVPYFDMVIGICLLFGLFTPLVALVAAGFLGSVFLGQYPPATGPNSSNYQLIECMACLVLAGTGAGRFAGIDYFLHLIVRKVWGAPTEKG